MAIRKRRSKRRSFYKSDGLDVTVRSGDRSWAGYVANASCGGLGLYLQGEADIQPCSRVDVVIKPKYGESGEFTTSGLVVFTDHATNVEREEVTRIGLSLVEDRKEGVSRSRSSRRYKCSEFISISGSASHPFLFQQKFIFRVLDFSRDGMSFVTSKSNTSLIIGLPLQLSLYIPTRNQPATVAGKISSVTIQEDGNIRVGVEYTESCTEFKRAVGEYLILVDSEVDLRQLKKIGYSAFALSDKLQFEFVHREQDLIEALRIRHACYSKRHPSISEKKPEQLLDKYDQVSRNFLVWLDSKPVATGRMTYPQGDPDSSEIEGKYGIKLPQFLWDSSFVEAAKFSVLPDYQKTDIYENLISFFALNAMQSGNDHIVTLCMDVLLPSYKKIGGVELGVRKYIEEHDVYLNAIYFKTTDLVLGKNMGSTRLSDFYSRIGKYLGIGDDSKS